MWVCRLKVCGCGCVSVCVCGRVGGGIVWFVVVCGWLLLFIAVCDGL